MFLYHHGIYIYIYLFVQQVLRPMYEVSALVPWSYLVGEELRHGSSYDPEVRTLDRQQEEEAEAADGTCSNSKRRIVMNGYVIIRIFG